MNTEKKFKMSFEVKVGDTVYEKGRKLLITDIKINMLGEKRNTDLYTFIHSLGSFNKREFSTAQVTEPVKDYEIWLHDQKVKEQERIAKTAIGLTSYLENIKKFKHGGYICTGCDFIMPLATTEPYKNNCTYCYSDRKTCTTCEISKIKRMFYKDKSKSDELSSICKDCVNKYWDKNPRIPKPPRFNSPDEHFAFFRKGE